MGYFRLMDSRILGKKVNGQKVKPMHLKVVQDTGIDVKPDTHITVTNLNKGGKHFFNTSSYDITFKVDIILKKDERWETGHIKLKNRTNYGTRTEWNGGQVRSFLKEFIKQGIPVYVGTEALDIPKGRYLITSNSSRKQTYKDYSVWTLEFTTYNELKRTTFKDYNRATNLAIRKRKYLKLASTPPMMLKKCDIKNLQYKKKNRCCYYLNYTLQKKGCLSLKWFNLMKKNKTSEIYNDGTKAGVKLFQKKYQKKFNLKVNGVLDTKTRNALCSI